MFFDRSTVRYAEETAVEPEWTEDVSLEQTSMRLRLRIGIRACALAGGDIGKSKNAHARVGVNRVRPWKVDERVLRDRFQDRGIIGEVNSYWLNRSFGRPFWEVDGWIVPPDTYSFSVSYVM